MKNTKKLKVGTIVILKKGMRGWGTDTYGVDHEVLEVISLHSIRVQNLKSMHSFKIDDFLHEWKRKDKKK